MFAAMKGDALIAGLASQAIIQVEIDGDNKITLLNLCAEIRYDLFNDENWTG